MIGHAVLAELAEQRHPSCDARIDYASRDRCWDYGTHWSPQRSFRLTGGFGMFMSSFGTAGRTFVGSASRSPQGFEPVRFDGGKLGTDTLDTTSFELRFHGHVWNGFYLGGALGVGYGRARTHTVQTESMQLEDDPDIDLLHLRIGVLVGYRIPLRWLSVRLESMLGLDVIGLDQQGLTPTGQRPGTTSYAASTLVEPRVALDIWASPWMTLSFFAGKSVLRAYDSTLGFTLSGHLRPFDGQYR